MDVGRIQAMMYTPINQTFAIRAAYLGYGTDGREPGVCPIVGQEGDLSAGDRFFPMLKFMPLHTECQGITACLMDANSVPLFGDRIN